MSNIFKDVVEPLMDSFLPENREIYIEKFTEAITNLRNSPEGRLIDIGLNKFGLKDIGYMREYAKGVLHTRCAQKFDIKKVFILSRVTIGADIAVTSVVIERVKKEFPDAEIVFIAPEKQRQLFDVTILPILYDRKSGFVDRIMTWLELVKLIDENTDGIGLHEYLIMDPDSRLSQLGIMPLPVNRDNYIYFNASLSKEEIETGKVLNITEATNVWLNKVFGGNDTDSPNIALRQEDKEFAEWMFEPLKGKTVIFINLGFGGNKDKRLSSEKELGFISRMADMGFMVMLDRGYGLEEKEQTQKIIDHLKDRIAVFEGSVGELAALIARSDYYIGYDSLGQHIANALDIPGTVIIPASMSNVFKKRWIPKQMYGILKEGKGYENKNG